MGLRLFNVACRAEGGVLFRKAAALSDEAKHETRQLTSSENPSDKENRSSSRFLVRRLENGDCRVTHLSEIFY